MITLKRLIFIYQFKAIIICIRQKNAMPCNITIWIQGFVKIKTAELNAQSLCDVQIVQLISQCLENSSFVPPSCSPRVSLL